MEESLKAARVIHQIVIVAATAMLVFAASTRSPENEYSKAREELQVLKSTVSQIDREASKEVRSNYADLSEYLKGQLGLDVRLHMQKSFENVYSEGTIGEIREGLLGLLKNITRRPDARVYQEIAEKIDAWRAENPRERCETMIVVVNLFESKATRVLCSDVQVAEFEPGAAGPYSGRTAQVLGVEGLLINRLAEVERHLKGQRSVEQHRRELERFVEAMENLEPGDVYDVLPATQAVWDEVARLDPVSAESALDRLSRESAQSSSPKLSVLGLEMNASTAIVAAGPAILVALLLYLYAHLLHIEAIAKGNEGLLREFPWLPLFDSRLSLGLSVATLWLLPSVAAMWTVWVSRLAVNVRTLLALGYVAGIGAVAFVGISKASELNRLGDSAESAAPAPAGGGENHPPAAKTAAGAPIEPAPGGSGGA